MATRFDTHGNVQAPESSKGAVYHLAPPEHVKMTAGESPLAVGMRSDDAATTRKIYGFDERHGPRFPIVLQDEE